MSIFVSYTDICKTAVNVKTFKNYRSGETFIIFSLKRKIYKWCLENKIRYKKYNKKEKGFIFNSTEDYIALKLRWFSNNE